MAVFPFTLRCFGHLPLEILVACFDFHFGVRYPSFSRGDPRRLSPSLLTA